MIEILQSAGSEFFFFFTTHSEYHFSGHCNYLRAHSWAKIIHPSRRERWKKNEMVQDRKERILTFICTFYEKYVIVNLSEFRKKVGRSHHTASSKGKRMRGEMNDEEGTWIRERDRLNDHADHEAFNYVYLHLRLIRQLVKLWHCHAPELNQNSLTS